MGDGTAFVSELCGMEFSLSPTAASTPVLRAGAEPRCQEEDPSTHRHQHVADQGIIAASSAAGKNCEKKTWGQKLPRA